MSFGIAKIVSVVGSGKYTITQQFYDTDTNTYKDGSAGLVDAPASDIDLDTTREVDDVVSFRMLETFDGKRQAVIMKSSMLPPFPTSNATYWLKLVVAGGVPTLSWGTTTEDCP
ncbi:MAG: hypothetical protein GY807_24855 [Gammaproteobacteria bacterium]|nr:hypothetical protein [Gammaproteobacteria bacterium]